MTLVFPDDYDPVAAAKQLESLVRVWGTRFEQFRLISEFEDQGTMTPAARRRFWETWLPVAEYMADLRHVLAHVVGHELLPTVVIQPDFMSLPDMWQSLTTDLAGRVVFNLEELLPLACSLAAPPRFGSAAGRYPEQFEWMTANLQLPSPFVGVDYGCGTGQGTWEFAQFLSSRGFSGSILGITAEPLEVWMAGNRIVPHLAGQEKYAFPAAVPDVTVSFAGGDILDMPRRGGCHVILCNGLIGGPFIRGGEAFANLWDRFGGELLPGGVLMVGDRFHDGRRSNVATFSAMAPDVFSCVELAGSKVFVKLA